jgi:ribosomal-protein-alanine N-acetyltransferase
MVEKMTLTSLDEIAEIERECFSVPYTKTMLESGYNTPSFLGLVDVCDKIRGYVLATVVLDEANIDRVAVKDKYRGQKIASNLIKSLEKELTSKGVKTVLLEVRRSNIPAISLYSSLGYVKIAERKNYYENREDALIFNKIL